LNDKYYLLPPAAVEALPFADQKTIK